MSQVTLDELKAEHARLAELIASFEQQSKTLLILPEAEIPLGAGEHYAGAILSDDGKISHHLVLLPGSAEDVTWEAAGEWARKTGGELPTRREQSLLYANLKAEFESAWYWSAESHENDGSYAWNQYFGNGYQNYVRKSYEARARAVRRFPG